MGSCCVISSGPSARRPPESIEVGAVVLRRHQIDDAAGIAEAVAASLPELCRWMPWASPEAADASFQRHRLGLAVPQWEEGSAFSYVVVMAHEVVGVMSLMARVGPDALEIGYWLRSDCTGRGIATMAAAALTSAALAMPDVEAVEIHCDEANVRSAAIPNRLGYRLDRVEDDEIVAPGEVGRSMIWVYPP
jgi:RimJ/RimL family protein N-acetyltransferase